MERIGEVARSHNQWTTHAASSDARAYTLCIIVITSEQRFRLLSTTAGASGNSRDVSREAPAAAILRQCCFSYLVSK